MSGAIPADAVAVGRIAGAFGIKGWIKVQPFSLDAGALFASSTWWLQADGPRPVALPASLKIEDLREQGDVLVARVETVADRNAAEALRGAIVHVARSNFPPTAQDEFYWVDLIGLSVVLADDTPVGHVLGLIDTGPHAVFRIAPEGLDKPSLAQEILIPFVSRFVLDVDLSARQIRVDWDLGWSQGD